MYIPELGSCTKFKMGSQHYEHNELHGTGIIIEELDDNERRKKIGRVSRAFHPDKSPGGDFDFVFTEVTKTINAEKDKRSAPSAASM